MRAEQQQAIRTALLGGGLDVAAVHAIAGQIGEAHASAPRADGKPFRAQLTQSASETQRAELTRLAKLIDRRAATGRVRLIDDAPTDILHDLARAIAAAVEAGHAFEANLIANRYLDIAPQGASGWALLPLFVSLHLADRERADAMLAPAPPRLVVIAGLSGTGKSTLARMLGARLGRVPGARVLRSDVFRKRRMGVSPETRLPPAHYTRASDDATFEAMFESADDHLACGNSVILDGVFMDRSERDVAEALADRWRVPFTGFWLEAPERDRIARITARLGDASDANEMVAREQSRRPPGEIHWHRIRANRQQSLIVAAARAALERKR
jgi:uncharacterized protein